MLGGIKLSNLLLFIAIVSFLAVFAFAGIAIVNYIGKNKEKGKKSLKKSGISLVVVIVSFIAFGVMSDKEEPKKVEVSGQVKEVVKKDPELTEEEKADLAKKEAEEKAIAETKKKAVAEAAALAEANRKKAEAEKKAKDEADAKALAELIAKEKAEKKANAQTIAYAQLKKNPDRYAGEYVKYTGEIVQILEGSDMTNIRLAVTKNSYGYDFNDLVFIEYLGYTDFVDGDIVTIYGEVYGAHSYESQAGYNISLPGIVAEEVVQ